MHFVLDTFGIPGLKYLGMNSIPSAIKLNEVRVRAAMPEEMERVRRELEARHYLGEAVKVGHGLVQIAETRERWVALLVWGASAKRLKGREAWIGWDARTRASRLKLVVNQHRFAVLVDGAANLASRVLSLSAKRSGGSVGGAARLPAAASGDLRGRGALRGDVLPGGGLAGAWADAGQPAQCGLLMCPMSGRSSCG